MFLVVCSSSFFPLCFVLFLIVIKIKDLRECCFVTLLRKRHLCRNVCTYSCCVPRQGVQLCAKLACSRNSLCKLQKHDTQGGKKKLAVLSQGSATCLVSCGLSRVVFVFSALSFHAWAWVWFYIVIYIRSVLKLLSTDGKSLIRPQVTLCDLADD